MSIANGDLLELLAAAWKLIAGAGGPASDGDWEKQSAAWHQDAVSWRGDYFTLRDRLKGEEGALEARIRATLEQAVVSDAEIAAVVRIACEYAEAFPANYVMRNPPADS